MKLQYISVIFVIIILPITIVFSEYISSQIQIVKLENDYDNRLLNSSYDAIKAYQLNTINNATSDIPKSKIDDLEAAVNSFFNSLLTNFNYTGYDKSVMNEYVPAVTFSMYDGYYIYSPFKNTLTGVDNIDKYNDTEYRDEGIINGLKPYVYYNCRYQRDEDDFIITYTLDNYITIEGYIGGEYRYEQGYLVSGITPNPNVNDGYIYNNVEINPNENEKLTEYLGERKYAYVKVNGTKYYYSGDYDANSADDGDYIFYINANGIKTKHVINNDKNRNLFATYYNKIMRNNSGYQYYKDAYEFTKIVLDDFDLRTLKSTDAVYDNSIYELAEIENIFNDDVDNGIYLEEFDSAFNRHRADIIRYTIQTNLVAAISGFSKYSHGDSVEYMMPKISETDWELLENNICIATFLQGMSIGRNVYNNYAVIPNNLTKEYVDEDDIYVLTNSNEYARVNDKDLKEGIIKSKNDLGYYPGVLKTNFERKIYYGSANDGNELGYDGVDLYYYPISYNWWDGKEFKASTQNINYEFLTPYLGSYTSIVSSSNINPISYSDMYKYVKNNTEDDSILRKSYYIALGRERYGAYKVANRAISVDEDVLTLDPDIEYTPEDPLEVPIVKKKKIYFWGDTWIFDLNQVTSARQKHYIHGYTSNMQNKPENAPFPNGEDIKNSDYIVVHLGMNGACDGQAAVELPEVGYQKMQERINALKDAYKDKKIFILKIAPVKKNYVGIVDEEAIKLYNKYMKEYCEKNEGIYFIDPTKSIVENGSLKDDCVFNTGIGDRLKTYGSSLWYNDIIEEINKILIGEGLEAVEG